ncbi:TadE/TadG family type IV pilus assembly protein [Paenibacillus kandeliae]|uniref:TadE/TadG family type IV pilus assembly protein n=1 Tax=Paenibacillus kandeliae TaxID=3231269 RepID=UPI0034584C1C
MKFNKHIRNIVHVIRQHLQNERGAQAIEFVGVLPLFFLMVLIVFQFASAAITAVTVKQAVMEGARAAMVEQSGESGYQTAIRNFAGNYKIADMSKSEYSSGGNTYVTVKVTLESPMLSSNLFDTSGLSIPISSSATVRKEDLDDLQ